MERKPNKKVNRPAIIVALVALLFVIISANTIYSLGFTMGQNKPKNIVVSGVLNHETQEEEQIDFNLFWQAWDMLKEKHVNSKDFNSQDLLEGAIKGLAGAFNDPNTSYFNKEDSKKFDEDIRGNFGGVGMEIGIRDGNLSVIAPLKGTPAENAGLRSLDRIIEIDGESTRNLSIEEAVKLIRGDIGTMVVLTIFREGWNEPREFEIIRDNIQIPTLEWEFKENKIAHVRLFSFNEQTLSLFNEAIHELARENAQGMVLDLRNNPGGFLQVAVNMAGWFLDRGDTVVIERFSSGTENVLRARGNSALSDFPTVILINKGSASASEILAGTLRHHKDIKLVGENTFGKGTVQSLNALTDDSTLKITIAKWVLPNDEIIDENGIEPDEEVEFPVDWEEGDPDPQLQRALEILQEQLTLNP